MTTRCLLAIFAIAFLVTGCDLFTASTFPTAAVPFAPHGQYAFWWQLTESCSGLTGSFARVHWYEIRGVDTYNVAGADGAAGTWWREGDRIVLAGNVLDDGRVVRHEMLHALIGAGGHPAAYFQDRCAGYVACSSSCIAERPPAPVPPDAAVLSSRQLAIQADLVPSVFSNGENDGWIAVIVSVRNPFGHPVWVSLDGFGGAARTFGATFASGIGTTEVSYSDRVGFLAGATQRAVEDVRLGGSDPLLPGSYRLFGFFNADTAPVLTLTVK